MSHTKGPWTLEGPDTNSMSGKNCGYEVYAGRLWIASVHGEHTDVPILAITPNAALVAAAPELLEALGESNLLIAMAQKILAEWIVPDSGICDHDCLSSLLGLLDGPEQRRVQAKTATAIAKAEGRA